MPRHPIRESHGCSHMGAMPPMPTRAPPETPVESRCWVARDNFEGGPYGPWALDLVAYEAVTFLPLPRDEDPGGWVLVRTARGEGWVPPTYLVDLADV